MIWPMYFLTVLLMFELAFGKAEIATEVCLKKHRKLCTGECCLLYPPIYCTPAKDMEFMANCKKEGSEDSDSEDVDKHECFIMRRYCAIECSTSAYGGKCDVESIFTLNLKLDSKGNYKTLDCVCTYNSYEKGCYNTYQFQWDIVVTEFTKKCSSKTEIVTTGAMMTTMTTSKMTTTTTTLMATTMMMTTSTTTMPTTTTMTTKSTTTIPTTTTMTTKSTTTIPTTTTMTTKSTTTIPTTTTMTTKSTTTIPTTTTMTTTSTTTIMTTTNQPIPNTKILVIGGDASKESMEYFYPDKPEAVQYNSKTNSWTELAKTLIEPRYSFSTVCLP